MDSLISSIDSILADAISWLPNSPFVDYLSKSNDADVLLVLRWVNLFVPITEMIIIGGLWLTSMAGYFLISVILKWAKAVG